MRSVKKSCVHIVHPDGRIIPFDTYNLFYRDDREHTVLADLRAGRGAPGVTPLSVSAGRDRGRRWGEGSCFHAGV